MFSLIALLSLYVGSKNLRKAFYLRPFSQWTYINWLLLLTGMILIVLGVICVYQSLKDYKDAQKEKEITQKEESDKRKKEFFYDNEETN